MLAQVTARLAHISDDELLDLRVVSSVLHLPTELDLDSSLQPRGFRLLSKIPRLPEAIADHVIERFGTLPKVMRASLSDLVEVEGVGEAGARDQGRAVARRRDVDPRSLRLLWRRCASSETALASADGSTARRSRLRRHRRVASAPRRRARGSGGARPARRHADRGCRAAPRHRRAAPAVRGHGPAPGDARPRGVRVRAVRGPTRVGTCLGREPDGPREGSRRLAADGHLRSGREPPGRRRRRQPRLGPRLLHGRPLRVQGRVDRPLRRRGVVLRNGAHARGLARTGSPHRTAWRSRRRWRRRSRSSARTTRGRPRPTSKRCVPPGAGGTDCEIVVVEGPITASSTTPTATCTAPTPRRGTAAWERPLEWSRRSTSE